MLTDWHNGAVEPIDQRPVHETFEEQAALRPDAIAVVYENQQLTYRQLNQRANKLAHYLRGKWVIPGTLVGLYAERSSEMVVGMLGILKAGGAYVPLDPKYPLHWLKLVLNDARPAVLLSERNFAKQLAQSGAEPIRLDFASEAIERQSEQNLALQLTGEHLAYVIYTSGSTGVPKGVAIPHSALANYISYAGDFFGLTPADRVLQFASISFDVAAEEIFSSLTRGATLVLRNDFMLSSVADFLETCAKWRTTVLDLPTAYWHELTATLFAEHLTMPDCIRLVVIGGERAIPERLAQWQTRIGSRVRLCNGYGPTEATIAATMCELTDSAGEDSLAEVSIGWPVSNVQVYVVDENLAPVPAGMAGELIIGGQGLARGYLNRPELTAEKFIPNPFGKNPDSRLYRTGDLARFRSDGKLEFLGRIDQQVKIDGYRIETGEIETVLRQHPAVWEAVVIAREDVPGDKRLVAYVVFVRQATVEAGKLRSFLRTMLPHYMVPSAVVFLDALPLTPNGKVDRRSLPLPDRSADKHGAFATPRDKLELRLVKIWQEVLDLSSVGAQDNFFDLGGDSLLAMRLLARIEKQFSCAISLATIFAAPTVEELAALLRGGREPLKWEWLVPFQTVGSKLPVFLCHASGELGRKIDCGHAIYGVRPHGLDGKAVPLTVEEMASDYISEIRMLQSAGPYLIGGYSFGGLLAFEVARQLQEHGQEVALLVLLDPDSPNSDAFGSNLSRQVGKDLTSFGSLMMREMVACVRAGVKGRFDGVKSSATMLRCQALLAMGRRVPEEQRLFYRLEMYGQAARRYIAAGAYSGRAVLLKTGKVAENGSFDWSRLISGELEVYEMPGSHLEAIQGPYLNAWAGRLRACLQNVTSASSSVL
jgi:amino acid adenylation domain-containing protein